MHLMLQQPTAQDYVIASGRSYALEDFVATAFRYFGLNWQDHVTSDSSLLRPSDISISQGDPTLARKNLGWQAHHQMPQVVQKMIESRLYS
jgi:GDPmannose 4,6-dehydratase